MELLNSIDFWIGACMAMLVVKIIDSMDMDDLLDNLKKIIKCAPNLPRTTKYSRQIKALCKQHNIRCRYRFHGDYSRAHADVSRRKIELTFPNKIEGITTAMHELGHILHPAGNSEDCRGWTGIGGIRLGPTGLFHIGIGREKLKSEICAWLWAFRNAPIPLDIKHAEKGLKSYIESADEEAIKHNKHLLARLDKLAGTSLAAL